MKSDPMMIERQAMIWAPKLIRQGWKHLGGMDFSKDGKRYDLSAANMDMLDEIVAKGLFVQKDEEDDIVWEEG